MSRYHCILLGHPTPIYYMEYYVIRTRTGIQPGISSSGHLDKLKRMAKILTEGTGNFQFLGPSCWIILLSAPLPLSCPPGIHTLYRAGDSPMHNKRKDISKRKRLEQAPTWLLLFRSEKVRARNYCESQECLLGKKAPPMQEKIAGPRYSQHNSQ